MDESEKKKMREAHEEWEARYCREGESIRSEGPTPNGGDYSVAYYYDSQHCHCKEEDATWISIVEYKADGTFVNSTMCYLKRD